MSYQKFCAWCRKPYQSKRVTSVFCSGGCRKVSFMRQGSVTEVGGGVSKDGTKFNILTDFTAVWGGSVK
jgi:hypothetical protein